MKPYDHKAIEPKWRDTWRQEKTYETSNDDTKPSKFILDMFPYPSGAGLHVGHPRGYIASDVYSRQKRMQGYNILHPMGWDAFGLPAENFAIKNKVHPSAAVVKNVGRFKQQLEGIGFDYDWSREINTTDPNYYKWTQWIFLQLYKKGLAYQSYEPINWCPGCQTGLANEDLEPDGTCERCGSVVEKKPMRQWVLKIRDYADRLIDDLELLERWPDSVKEAQRNWIGRSYGAELKFQITSTKSQTNSNDQNKKYIKVFTTRPDTLFGATYMVIAPEHQLVHTLENRIENLPEVKAYIESTQQKSEIERTDMTKEKTGVELKGIKAINPATGEAIPVWIADYVLIDYGTGAIMAVPFHDERDFEFAQKFNIPMRQVVALEYGTKRENEEFKDGGCAVIFDPKTQKYAFARWQDNQHISLYAGGVDEGEELDAAILREVREESGLHDFVEQHEIGYGYPHYYNQAKKLNRVARAKCLLLICGSTDTKDITLEEHENFALEWLDPTEVLDVWRANNPDGGYDHYIWFLQQAVAKAIALGHDTSSNTENFTAESMAGSGFLVNSSIAKVGDQTYYQPKRRDVVKAVLVNDQDEVYLVKEEGPGGQSPLWNLPGGSYDPGEDDFTALTRELQEETGYSDVGIGEKLGSFELIYQHPKKGNLIRRNTAYVVILNSDKQQEAELPGQWFSQAEAITELEKGVYKGEIEFIRAYQGEKFDAAKAGDIIEKITFDGIESEEAKAKITEFVGGEMKTTYKLRDWVFSRQRYWGEPIPMVHVGDATHPVAESQLPVVLPEVDSYAPTGTGESPLADITDWVNVTGYINDNGEFVVADEAPGGSELVSAKRETNTMPQWAGSSWYYLRYIDNQNDDELIDSEKEKQWSPVDVYVGGDHATRHLIYARFWHKFLYDIDVVSQLEPFQRLEFLGYILAEDGRKISKREKNGADPLDIIERFGADSFRTYVMFMGPFENTVPWSTDGLVGTRRFIEKVWRNHEKVVSQDNTDLNSSLHKTIKKVGEDIEGFKFNTAVSALMILVNEIDKADSIGQSQYKSVLQLLAPMAPHMTEELWRQMGETTSIHLSSWPEYDEALTVDDEIVIGVQMNGKLRGEITVARDSDEGIVREQALALPGVVKHMDGKDIKRFIYVPNKIVNIVV